MAQRHMSKSKITGFLVVVLFGASSFYFQDLFASQDKTLSPGSEYAKEMLQKKCKVKRTTNEWAEVQCALKEFKSIERNCDVLVKGGDLTAATLLCRGAQASWVQRDCKVWLSGISGGELACLEKSKKRLVRFMSRYEGGKQERTNIFGT